jgi:hypothetical protein
VKTKFKTTSSNKPRPFANHPKKTLINSSLNLVSITMIKLAKKLETKFQRLWLLVTLLNTIKSKLSYNRKSMKPTLKNRIIQLLQKRLTSWLELIHKKIKNNMLRTSYSSIPVKMLRISSLLSNSTNLCDRFLWKVR